MTASAFFSYKPRHLWLYVIAAVASLGGLLSGFDTGVISGALLFINDTWPLTSLAKGWVVSSALVGAVIGAAANGVLADMYGRKKVIIATAVIFALGSILCLLRRLADCRADDSRLGDRYGKLRRTAVFV